MTRAQYIVALRKICDVLNVPHKRVRGNDVIWAMESHICACCKAEWMSAKKNFANEDDFFLWWKAISRRHSKQVN